MSAHPRSSIWANSNFELGTRTGFASDLDPDSEPPSPSDPPSEPDPDSDPPPDPDSDPDSDSPSEPDSDSPPDLRMAFRTSGCRSATPRVRPDG